MEFLKQLQALITNEILLVPAFAWFVAQLLKALINGIVHKEWSAERLWGDGGMPSGHSATVTSLALMCGFLQGFGSVYFAITAILAIIVMHDALGVRRETGKQAVSIIKMVAIINDNCSSPLLFLSMPIVAAGLVAIIVSHSMFINATSGVK